MDIKQNNTNKYFNMAQIFFEIFLQYICFLGLFLAGIIGIAGKNNDSIKLCLTCIIPVVITYLTRKFIKSYAGFMAINIILPFLYLGFAKNDLEIVMFLICGFAISIKSITVKTAMNRVTESAKDSPVSKSFMETAANNKDYYDTFKINEKMHIAWVIVMIVGYYLGEKNNNALLLYSELVLFVLFILGSVIYNQIRQLNKAFSINMGKSNFPIKRIININLYMTVVVIILMLGFMLLFYNGKYGNFFTIIGGFLFGFFKWIIKGLLFLWGLGPDETSDVGPSKEAVSEDAITTVLDTSNNNAAILNSLFEVVALSLVIALVIFVIYMIFKYAKGFRKSKMDEIDEVEFADSTDSYEHGSFTFKKKESNVKLTNNKAYRKAYKHKVKTKNKKNIESNKNFSDVSYMLPNELSSKLIVSDKEKAMNITKSYEKARYSKEEVTKEEIKYLKSL